MYSSHLYLHNIHNTLSNVYPVQIKFITIKIKNKLSSKGNWAIGNLVEL